MRPHDVLRLAEENGARVVDFKFVDVPGSWQHFTFPLSQMEPANFYEGLGFVASHEGMKLYFGTTST